MRRTGSKKHPGAKRAMKWLETKWDNHQDLLQESFVKACRVSERVERLSQQRPRLDELTVIIRRQREVSGMQEN